ncbi:hypothetical protein O0880_14490 [Janthinobacterium sp. SUN118]|uniref:hypothetical protein n=1 Tax=Janthinobacterium sp. SUN118 TaxID=3004100 RepID=UPI0025B0D193|nr:hypothetical protein [Janthinobacterium sp. SUN118]MDN2710630.1 hypothetical protein [Janthinobacterium sp. SUN118]
MKIWQAFCGIGIVSFAVGYIGAQLDWASNNAPAWVQAVGSIVAIFTAIWIPWHQQRLAAQSAERTATNEMRALLELLELELLMNFEALQTTVGPMLEADEQNGAFLAEYPVPANPVEIFNALLPKIGIVQPAELRTQIVRASNACGGLAMNFSYNNRLASAWNQLNMQARRTQSPEDLHAVADARRELESYGPLLRSQWLLAKGEIGKTLSQLNAVLR